MKKQELRPVKEKITVKVLPGNIKLTEGKSLNEKYEHAKAVSASIKSLKK